MDQAIGLTAGGGNGKTEDGDDKNHVQRKANQNGAYRKLWLAGEVSTQQGPGEYDSALQRSHQHYRSKRGGEESSDICQRYAQVLVGRGQHEQAAKSITKGLTTLSRH